MIVHSKGSTWLDPALCNYCIYRRFAAQLDEHSMDPYYIVYTASWMTTVKWLKKWIVASQHATGLGIGKFHFRIKQLLLADCCGSADCSTKTSRKKRQKADPSRIFTDVGPFRGMAPLCSLYIYYHVLQLEMVKTNIKKKRKIQSVKLKWSSSWWFQPIWKICSSNWIISPKRGEHKRYLKPPPSHSGNDLIAVKHPVLIGSIRLVSVLHLEILLWPTRLKHVAPIDMWWNSWYIMYCIYNYIHKYIYIYMVCGCYVWAWLLYGCSIPACLSGSQQGWCSRPKRIRCAWRLRIVFSREKKKWYAEYIPLTSYSLSTPSNHPNWADFFHQHGWKRGIRGFFVLYHPFNSSHSNNM